MRADGRRIGSLGWELGILSTVSARRDLSSPTSVTERTCDDFPGSDVAVEKKRILEAPGDSTSFQVRSVCLAERRIEETVRNSTHDQLDRNRPPIASKSL